MKVLSGLDQIKKIETSKIKGNIGLLCHSASINKDIKHAIDCFEEIFGEQFTKIFSPQHGLVSDVQDNMIESDHYIHSHYKKPVYSLYSETRAPTKDMLQDLDAVFIDMQDVGCRIYTYIYTMALMMQECTKENIKVFILDRPNPIGGLQLEGNILDPKFSSFVGMYPMPVRHAMTMGEVALYVNDQLEKPCELQIIEMSNWKREYYFEETGLPWVLPSPNLATPEAALTFVGSVLFEGTNISEGRGTARALEIIGHPNINAYKLLDLMSDDLKNLNGFILRPISFMTTFNKHMGKSSNGFQIHVTNREDFKPWKLCQILMKHMYNEFKEDFSWKQPPYEYEYIKLPMDMINGTDQIRKWIESKEDVKKIDLFENSKDFKKVREKYLLY